MLLENILGFFKHYFGGLYKRIDEHHLFLVGGGLAFSLLLTTIPLTLIIFSVLGNLIDPQTVGTQVKQLIDTIIPYPVYAEYATRIVMSRIPEVIQYKDIAAYIGGFGLFFVASGLFSSMRTVLNNIFGVTADKHPVIGKIRDFGMVWLLIIFILLSTFILPALNILISKASNYELLKFFRLSGFIDYLFSIISLIVIFTLFFLFYYLIPYEKLGKRIPAVAALWTTFLWELVRNLFGYYISHIANLNKIYGTYALIIVVAFWIYYSSVLFILGAEIGQLYRERIEVLKNKEQKRKNFFNKKKQNK
ncbi:MAG: YihY/virulence factor BrkB family protein [Ignavibacteria bacterium]|nr:YihY/virulence factor BrkB family protein [Ignavibacteria bacterium]